MRARLTIPQLDKLSDLALGLGQLFFASTVIPYIIPSVAKPPTVVLLFGLGFALGFWAFAIWVVKGVKK